MAHGIRVSALLFFLGCFVAGFALGRKTRLFTKRRPLVAHMTVPRGTTVKFQRLGESMAELRLRDSFSQIAHTHAFIGNPLLLFSYSAVLGPVALAWGLQHTSGSSASLMLTLEALFTAALAWRCYGEVMDRRVLLAMLLLFAGAVLLVAEQGLAGQAQSLGLLAVMLATLAWGLDNILSRGVADLDPGQVVMVKALLGTAATLGLALLAHEPRPHALQALALLGVGATGYGLSLRCYLLAQRAFGASRTGSVFAFAPFIGALGAWLLGERAPPLFCQSCRLHHHQRT